jgi:hypothetical protein
MVRWAPASASGAGPCLQDLYLRTADRTTGVVVVVVVVVMAIALRMRQVEPMRLWYVKGCYEMRGDVRESGCSSFRHGLPEALHNSEAGHPDCMDAVSQIEKGRRDVCVAILGYWIPAVPAGMTVSFS